MVKVTLEFLSVDAAIVALAKLVGAPSAKRGHPSPAAAGEQSSSAEASYSAPPATAAPATPKGARKPRADKGQPREPYKPRVTEAGAVAQPAQAVDAQAGAATSVNSADQPGVTESGSEASASAGTPTAGPSTVPGPVPAAAPASSTPVAAVSHEAAQAMLEQLFNKKGIEVARGVMSRFGVNKLRELPEASRSEFIAWSAKVLAGGAV